jgi:glycosyltransferase involved in cell wall biosynthesis
MAYDFPVTIALLTYNRCRKGYLKASLDAILAQSFTDFELLVVDNHSTDDTAELVSACDDPRLTYVRLPPGGNPTTSYIRSALMARGRTIIMAHDDDIMEPTLIERQMALLKEHPDLLLVGSNVSLMDEAGTTLQPRLYDLAEDTVFDIGEYIGRYFEEKLWLPAPTLLFEREHFLAAVCRHLGTKAPAYLASGDLWLLFTLNLQGRIAMLADPLLRYRQHGGQESRNVDQGSPVIEALQMFLDQNGSQQTLKKHMVPIAAFMTRFKAQDACFTSHAATTLTAYLNDLRADWLSSDGTPVDALLPFEILLRLLGLAPLLSGADLDRIEALPARGGGRQGFRRWLRALLDGQGLFAENVGPQHIAIHGSMLNAYLIKLAAERAGVQVAACFDSSPARIGKQIFGTPVLPTEQLATFAGDIDAVILSSEHDQENALKELVAGHLPDSRRGLPVISWKQLAAQAVCATARSQ